MLLGVVVLVAGVFIFVGAAWARLVGVIVAVVWAIVAFAWHSPVWGIALLAISITVIWTLTVHGSAYAEGDKKVAAVRLAWAVVDLNVDNRTVARLGRMSDVIHLLPSRGQLCLLGLLGATG